MWTLIKNNSVYFILYTLVGILISTIHWFDIGQNKGLTSIFKLLIWTLLPVFFAILQNEENEKKNNGYLLLKAIPITDKDIIYSKFFLSAITVIFMTLYNLLISFFIIKNTEFYKTIYPLVILWGLCCLIYSANIYIGKLKNVSIENPKYVILMIALVAFFLFFYDQITEQLNYVFNIFISFINTGFWVLLIPIGIFIYIKQIKKAIIIKENNIII